MSDFYNKHHFTSNNSTSEKHFIAHQLHHYIHTSPPHPYSRSGNALSHHQA